MVIRECIVVALIKLITVYFVGGGEQLLSISEKDKVHKPVMSHKKRNLKLNLIS